MIRALLFDFDGVVVDTEAPTSESWREVYAEHGVDLPLEVYLPAVGTGSSTSETDGGFDAVSSAVTRRGAARLAAGAGSAARGDGT
jgi:beta-phosphoglucomutase-like phosphatase (HAD superfamily)